MVRPNSDLWRIRDVLKNTRLIRAGLSAIEQAVNDVMVVAPETVFHLGWDGVTWRSKNDLRQVEENLIGSVRLLNIAQRAGCTCWVGVGSQAEYGASVGVLLEDLPTHPRTLYGVTKLCVSLLTRQICQQQGTRYVWLRLLATYGPKDAPEHLIPSVVLKLLEGERPTLTAGEQRWDYLYVEDAAEAIYTAAMQPHVQGIYNLGSGEVHTVRAIVTCIRDLIDHRLPLGLGEVPYPPDQIMHLQAEGADSVFRRLTHWAPTIEIMEGLLRTVEWYRTNRNRYVN